MISNTRIAVIGLGYVGLPLARLFATKYPVVGFDINQSRINGLLSGTDSTLEISEEVLQAVLLDKTHVAIMAFHKFKKRINESSNQWFVLFCYTKRYCGLQLLYHYCSHSS
jgi:UDP-N-acetyl-D-mannosaminuronate dehydrogenase